MGRKTAYRPGSFYRADDRTGFPQRAERTVKEWNGLIVDRAVAEARQPQDLVTGVRDDQAVTRPRILSPAVYVGPVAVTLALAARPGDTTLHVDTIKGLTDGTMVGVVLANGEVFRTTMLGAGDTVANLYAGLPYPAAAGAELIDYGTPGDPAALAILLDEDGAPILDEAGGQVLQDP